MRNGAPSGPAFFWFGNGAVDNFTPVGVLLSNARDALLVSVGADGPLSSGNINPQLFKLGLAQLVWPALTFSPNINVLDDPS